MAIQFSCPSCRQPIEVDDSWAGQSVGCPYCRKVITAPQSSELPGSQIPMASPAQSRATPPQPPMDAAPPLAPTMPQYTAGGGHAGWSLALALCGAALAILGWLISSASNVAQAMAKYGPNPSQQQIYENQMEMLQSGKLIPQAGVTIFLVGTVCGLCAIWLAVRCLLRREGGRGMAIASCVIGACFTFCQAGMMIANLLISQMRGAQ